MHSRERSKERKSLEKVDVSRDEKEAEFFPEEVSIFKLKNVEGQKFVSWNHKIRKNRGGVFASHAAAPGLILGVPKKLHS